MFLATLAFGATGRERSNVLRAAGRRVRAVDDRLGGSADGRGRATDLDGAGRSFDLSERSGRVGGGLRSVGARFDERRLSVASRDDGDFCGRRRNVGRLRERRLGLRRDVGLRRFERLLSLRRDVDERLLALRRNGV